MKILLITWNFPPKVGGLENVMYNLWQRLGQVYPVHVIAPAGAVSKEKQGTAGRLYRCPSPSLALFAIYSFIKGALLIYREKIDIIFAGSALTSPIVVLLGKLFNKKTVTHVFGLDVIYPHPVYQKTIPFFLRRNDCVIAVSNSAVQQLQARKIVPGCVRVVYPGIDLALFKQEVDQQALKQKYAVGQKKVILSVCRLAKRKGIAWFIRDVLPLVRSSVPEAIYLVVGASPTESLAHRDDVFSQLQAIVKASAQGQYVHLLGNVSQQSLIELYNLCDIFVLPVIPMKNDTEGFGLCFIEANAAGKATVGTDIGGIPEAIEDGKSGIVTAADDPQGLAGAIIDLLQHPLKATALGAYGRKRAQERFNWSVAVKNYVKVLDEVAGKPMDRQRWESAYVNLRRGLRKRKRRIALFGLKTDAKIIELGCGDGLNLEALRQLGYLHLVGLDNSAPLLGRICSVPRLLGDITSLGIANCSFDAVFIDSVLHHLNDLDKGLAEIKRILRPAGILCVMEPRPSWARRIMDMATFSPLASVSRTLKYRQISLQEEYALYSHWLGITDAFGSYLEKHGFKVIFWKNTALGMLIKCRRTT